MQPVYIPDTAWRTTFPRLVAPLAAEWLAGLLLRCDDVNHWGSGTTLLHLRYTTDAYPERYNPNLIVPATFKFDRLAQVLGIPNKDDLIITTYLSELSRCYAHELRNEINFDQALDFWNQNGKIECILLCKYSRLKDETSL